MIAHLIPLSELGEKIVEKYGTVWNVEREEQGSPFFNAPSGEWLFVTPYEASQLSDKFGKWVKKKDDENFEVVC